MNVPALIVSLKLAFLSTAILLALGLPLAYWLASTRWRFSFLIEALVSLPLVLPPTVLGFYLLMALGAESPLGQALEALSGGRIPFSFTGILIGALVFNMPFAMRPFTSAFAGVDRRLVEESWVLGVSKTRTFFKVELPMAWPGILTGIVLAFSHALGEFGVVLMLGGNIPGATQTISTVIYDEVQAMDYAAANHTALLLMLFSFSALCVVFSLQRKALPL